MPLTPGSSSPRRHQYVYQSQSGESGFVPRVPTSPTLVPDLRTSDTSTSGHRVVRLEFTGVDVFTQLVSR